MIRFAWLFLGMVVAAVTSCNADSSSSSTNDPGEDGDGDEPGDGSGGGSSSVNPPCEGPQCYGYCDTNPCGAGQTCVPYEGCKAAVGEACATHYECASRLCRGNGTCGVQLGSPCTVDNCDNCQRFADSPDVTFCAGECTSKDDCAGLSPCLGYQEIGYICWPACHADCQSCTQEYGYEGNNYVLQYEACSDTLEPVPLEPEGMGGAGGDGDATWDCATDCGGFGCADSVCLTSCTSSVDCAPGHSCMPDGVCYPGGDEGAPCETSADCATNLCSGITNTCAAHCSSPSSSFCGTFRGMECTCIDGYYCDLNGPDERETYKECVPKKDSFSSSCLEDYECESDNCCQGSCEIESHLCVGDPCDTYGTDECGGFGNCSEPLSGPGVCVDECTTVGEECWNETVCVDFPGSQSSKCMIRCAASEDCVAAYGPEYQCEEDGLCHCFETICPI